MDESIGWKLSIKTQKLKKKSNLRTVIKFLVTCSLVLHTHNKIVTLWVNSINNRQLHTYRRGPIEHTLSLFQALSHWGRSKKGAGDKRDQRRAGSGREKERVGEPASILLNFIPPKRNCFLCRNVRCQNLHIFGIPMISLSQPALRQPYITSQSNALFSVVFIMVDSRNNFFANSNMADFHFQGCRHLEYSVSEWYPSYISLYPSRAHY